MGLDLSFIFPGQGSQALGMGRDFYDNFDIAKDMINSVSDKLRLDFKKVIFEDGDRLALTQYTQPAVLSVSLIAHKIFLTEFDNFNLKYSLGHSLGEFSALCSVGAISFEDAVYLVYKRGELMQKCCDNFDPIMAVILGMSDDKVENICENARDDGKKVWVANYNCEGQIVVAGVSEDIKSLEDVFKKEGAKKVMFIKMSVISHCPLLEDMADEFSSYVDKSVKDSFLSPVISNVNAKPYSSKKDAITLLKDQLTHPVMYKQSILAYYKETSCMIEFGNGTVLKGLNKKISKDIITHSIFDVQSLNNALLMIGN